MNEDLNEAQNSVILSPPGPILVVAGAGTGKTNTLVNKLASLVQNGFDPSSLLLLTFTRRAAKEMLNRAATKLDSRMLSVQGGTFHSFCHHFLRKYSLVVSLNSNFTILDEDDATSLVGMARDQVVTKQVRFPKKETLVEIFSSCFNLQISLEKLLQKEYPMFLGLTKEIQEIKSKYIDLKLKHNSLDFDDLLDFTRKILMEEESIRERVGLQYQYILVDEYQDTNRIQAHIACLLASKHQNILVVGDDAQCIYGFRGANVNNMLDFPKIFPNTKTIHLTENYRSFQPILELANSVLDQSKENYKKHLVSNKQSSSNKPKVIKFESSEEEANWITEEILELYEDKTPLSEIVVLFRAGYISNLLEVKLTAKQIPFRKYGGKRFLDLAHVKDLLAYLRIIDNPKDILSWNRVLLLEKQIGKKYAQLLYKNLETNGFQWDLVDNSPTFFLGIPEQAKTSFQKLIKVFQSQSLNLGNSMAIVEAILTHYFPILEEEYDDFDKRKLDLESFKILSKSSPNLSDYLANLTLDPTERMDTSPLDSKEDDFLTLSTIHSAKGLEWKYVFTMQVVEGSLPSSRIKTTQELEEERRLFYVAITRAKQGLYLTSPVFTDKNRLTTISRFLVDLPNLSELVEEEQPVTTENQQEIPKSKLENDRFLDIQRYFLN
ncbi:ATP-dependent helicase [Leptospira meyeri]|uniref:ATP-dependent helicase n=1 Tax=Leptospira meyeri TaxID=29508 RepID=UPI000C2B4620|nr:ATP-dependent helicase [Leptospira meyeri]PJZ82476.1 ATP-dependent DNA helicase [Leptospira meyeri]PJZ98280.1 ATP-dependent DNA helicase [Leptospira meyeri]PKA10920.1 ATP-dependent DNA helicase [Leptospira meyeri]TGL10486.1 ATP-dependent helicase [Leptospira meyeri]